MSDRCASTALRFEVTELARPDAPISDHEGVVGGQA
jgi:hypothetical protein